MAGIDDPRSGGRTRRILLGALVVTAVAVGGTLACERHVETTWRRRLRTAGERVVGSPAGTPASRQALRELLDEEAPRRAVYGAVHARCRAILADGAVSADEIAWLTELLRDALALSDHEFARRYHGSG